MRIGENAPPIHPNCRCSISAYFDDDGYDEWLDSFSEHGLDFEEWKATKGKTSVGDTFNKDKMPKEMKHARFETADNTESSGYLENKRIREFYGVPKDVTKQWVAAKEEELVLEGKEYSVDGKTYKVDGKRVLSDHTNHEKDVAKVVAKESGRDVQLVPRILFPQGIQTPDYLIDGSRYDLKTPIGNGKNTLYGMVKSKKKQANNFVICVDRTSLSLEEIDRQIIDIYKSKHTSFVDNIILVREDKIIKAYSRKRWELFPFPATLKNRGKGGLEQLLCYVSIMSYQ